MEGATTTLNQSLDDNSAAQSWTPFFQACHDGNMGMVASFLESGVDHFLLDSSKRTVLHVAIINGQAAVVEKLLDYHFSTKGKPQNLPPPHTFTYHEVKQNVAPRSRADRPSITPLEQAAEVNNADIFNLLLGKVEHQNRNAVDVDYFNGLWPWRTGRPLIVGNIYSCLLRPDRPIVEGHAIYHGQTREERQEALLYSAIRDDKFTVVTMLLSQGANPNTPFIPGYQHSRTPLQTAAIYRNCDRYIQTLLNYGADPTLVNDQLCPLQAAIISSNEAAAVMLLEAGAHPNIMSTTAWRCSPLFAAAGMKAKDPEVQLRLIRRLVEKGADVDAIDSHGRTALHIAAKNKFGLNAIRELISLNADATAADQDGETVYNYLAKGFSEYADYTGTIPLTPSYTAIIDYLLQHFPAEDASNHPYFNPLHNSFSRAECGSLIEIFARAGFTLERPPVPGDFEEALRGVIYYLKTSTIPLFLESFADSLPVGSPPMDFLSALIWKIPVKPLVDQSVLETLDKILSAISLLFEAKLITIMHLSRALMALVKDHRNNPHCIEVLAGVLLQYGADRYYTLPESPYADSIALAAMHNKPTVLAILLQDLTEAEVPDHWLQPFHTVRRSVQDDSTAVFACLKQAGLLEPGEYLLRSEPLCVVLEQNDVDTFSKILSCGVNIEREDEYGWRLLHLAIFKGHESIVDALLKADANVHATTHKWDDKYLKPSIIYNGDPWAGQPLHVAAMFGQKSIVQKLLALGVDVNASTGLSNPHFPGHGPTALHIALDTGKFYGRRPRALDKVHLSIAQLLVDHGADTTNAAAHLTSDDVLEFGGFESLWDILRKGIQGKPA